MATRFIGRFMGCLTLTLSALSIQAQELERSTVIDGKPDFNGIWQAMNQANWNLEAHSAEALDEFWKLGAVAAIPAGRSVVQEGSIPYLPEALEERDRNRANWPAADTEAKCYMLGIPRYTYHEQPFQIFQSGADEMLMVYPFAAGNRVIHMGSSESLPIDSWMGRSNGRWDGDVLEIVTINQNGEGWLDRAGNHFSNELVVTERFTLLGPNHIWYEATLEDPQTYAEPWTIEMPLYRHIGSNDQLLEHKCVPFADKLLYSDLMGLE
ncbi:MAG TPA: hypothetical protein GX696_02225 [Pseudomonadaceae bacterium]|nr:hypothetical protein [Pseudomonadaceae bacterium]